MSNTAGVSIKELHKPNKKPIKMNCDKLIHEKLKEYPMILDAFGTSSFNVVLGGMGAGKTSWMTSLVKNEFKKVFECIILIMPESSRKSIEDDIFGKNLPPDQLYDTISESILLDVLAKLEENTAEGYNSLLIIDDFQTHLKNPDIAKVLETIIIKTRHLRVTTFYLVQSYVKIPKSIRLLVYNWIVFNVGKESLLTIFDEIIQMKKHKFEAIIDLCYKDSHDWLLINLRGSKNIYRNYDLVQF